MAKKLLNFFVGAVLFSAAGVGLIRSCHQNYDNSRPGVVYCVDGKPVIQRRFDTNGEFEKYLNSEQGKNEKECYEGLNKRAGVRH